MEQRHSESRHELTVVARAIIGSAAVAVLVGCGTGEGLVPLEIRQLYPSGVGARTPDFDLVIYGTGFMPDSRVLIGDAEFGPVHRSSSLLIVHVPGGSAVTTVPGTLSVSVNAGGAHSNQLDLVVADAPAPVLSEVSAANLCYGNGPLDVTLTGDNFTIDTTLESGGEAVPIARLSRRTISFQVPRAYGNYSFQVTVPPPGGGQASIDYPTFLGCD
jgi:hypothetical protein